MTGLLLPILILIAIIVIFGSALYASFRASPWLPVFKKDIERILKLAEIKQGEVVIDLGSGDGRIVMAMANGSPAKMVVGYEVSLIPYLWSKIRIWFFRSPQAEIRFGDFLRRDLSCASIIFCFLTPMAMKKLAPKFRAELKLGTRIISYSFSLADWTPVATDKPTPTSIPIYKYIV